MERGKESAKHLSSHHCLCTHSIQAPPQNRDGGFDGFIYSFWILLSSSTQNLFPLSIGLSSIVLFCKYSILNLQTEMEYWILSHFLSWAINFGTEVFRHLVKMLVEMFLLGTQESSDGSDNSWLCCGMVTANHYSRTETSYHTSLRSLMRASQEKDQWGWWRSRNFVFCTKYKEVWSFNHKHAFKEEEILQ